MRRIEAIVLQKTATMGSCLFVAHLTVLCGVFLLASEHQLFVDPVSTRASDFRLQLGLLATIGVTALAWLTLRAFGSVGAGSGAGLRLAALGLAARIAVAFYLTLTGGEATGSIYDQLPQLTGTVWWVRHLSLVAYGCGIALVVLASAADIVRGRRTSTAGYVPD